MLNARVLQVRRRIVSNTLAYANLNNHNLHGNNALTGFTLRSDGVIEFHDDGSTELFPGSNTDYSYALFGATGAEFEAFAVKHSGSTPTGTFGTWLPLSVSRSWTFGPSGSSKVCLMSVEIRRASDFTSLTSGLFALDFD